MQNVIEHAADINLLIMIMQGSDDKLVNPSGAQLLYDLVGFEIKHLKSMMVFIMNYSMNQNMSRYLTMSKHG